MKKIFFYFSFLILFSCNQSSKITSPCGVYLGTWTHTTENKFGPERFRIIHSIIDIKPNGENYMVTVSTLEGIKDENGKSTSTVILVCHEGILSTVDKKSSITYIQNGDYILAGEGKNETKWLRK